MEIEVRGVIRHLDALKRITALGSAIFYIGIEANLCWVRAKSIYHAIRQTGYPNLRFLTSLTGQDRPIVNTRPAEDSPDRVGIWLGRDEHHKLRMAMHISAIAAAGRLKLLEGFISDPEHNVLDMLKQQLTCLELIPDVAAAGADGEAERKATFTQTRYAVSGKRHGKVRRVSLPIASLVL
jgi:hypothetical protein